MTKTAGLWWRFGKDAKYKYLYLSGIIVGALVTAAGQAGLVEWMRRMLAQADVQSVDGTIVPWDLLLAVPVILLINSLGVGLGGLSVRYGANHAVQGLRVRAFGSLMRQSLEYIQAHGEWHLVTRLTQTAQRAGDAAAGAVGTMFKDTFVIIAMIGYIIYIAPTQMFVVALCVVGAAVVNALAGRISRKTATQLQQATGELTGLSAQSLEGAPIVKVFQGEAREQERFRQAGMATRRYSNRLGIATVLSGFLVDGLAGVLLFVIALSVFGVFGGSAMPSADVAALMFAIGALLRPARAMANLTVILHAGAAALDELYGLVDSEPEQEDGVGRDLERPLKGGIEFRNVTYTYPAAQGREASQVLRGLNLKIEPGETVALVGESGGGKSTIAKIAACLIQPQTGQVLFDGMNAVGLDLRSLRSQVSYVSQRAFIFDDTIRENIAYGAQSTDEAIWNAAERAAIADFIRSLPRGLDTRLGGDHHSMSGGQLQRIALARAFFRDAPILVLDEATSALDQETEIHVQRVIQDLSRGRTVIAIAHRPETAIRADRVVLIKDGDVGADGDHNELLRHDAIYRRTMTGTTHAPQPEAPAVHPLVEVQNRMPWFIRTPITLMRYVSMLLAPFDGLIAQWQIRRHMRSRRTITGEVPVVAVGGVLRDGSGCEDFTSYMIDRLAASGQRVGVAIRQDDGVSGEARLIPSGATAFSAGGWASRLASDQRLTVATARTVEAASRLLLMRGGIDIVIAHDALSRYGLRRAFEVAVVDLVESKHLSLALTPTGLSMLDWIAVRGFGGQVEPVREDVPQLAFWHSSPEFRHLQQNEVMSPVEFREAHGLWVHLVARSGEVWPLTRALEVLGFKVKAHVPNALQWVDPDALRRGDEFPIVASASTSSMMPSGAAEIWELSDEVATDATGDLLVRRVIEKFGLVERHIVDAIDAKDADDQEKVA